MNKKKFTHKKLINEILQFCDINQLNKTQFGKIAMNDPNFVFDLENGRKLNTKTYRKINLLIKGEPC